MGCSKSCQSTAVPVTQRLPLRLLHKLSGGILVDVRPCLDAPVYHSPGTRTAGVQRGERHVARDTHASVPALGPSGMSAAAAHSFLCRCIHRVNTACMCNRPRAIATGWRPSCKAVEGSSDVHACCYTHTNSKFTCCLCRHQCNRLNQRASGCAGPTRTLAAAGGPGSLACRGGARRP
jgi:hypothetical protein